MEIMHIFISIILFCCRTSILKIKQYITNDDILMLMAVFRGTYTCYFRNNSLQVKMACATTSRTLKAFIEDVSYSVNVSLSLKFMSSFT